MAWILVLNLAAPALAQAGDVYAGRNITGSDARVLMERMNRDVKRGGDALTLTEGDLHVNTLEGKPFPGDYARALYLADSFARANTRDFNLANIRQVSFSYRIPVGLEGYRNEIYVTFVPLSTPKPPSGRFNLCGPIRYDVNLLTRTVKVVPGLC